jgi:YbbR domain-containing protein
VTRNLTVKIVCVLLALVLWAQAASQQDVEEVAELPLKLIGLPDSLAVRRSQAPEAIWVRLRESKLERVLHDLLSRGRGEVEVDLSGVSAGDFRHDISVREITGGGTPLSVESPATLHLKIYHKTTSLVPVRVNLEGQLDEGFILAGRPDVTPAEVKVVGPGPLVSALDHVNTLPLKISRRRRSFRETVRLAPPDPDLVLLPVEVDVALSIDQIVERTFDKVPLSVLSDRVDSTQIYVQPQFAKVRMKGPAHSLESIKLADVSVVLHLGAAKGGVYQIEPDVLTPEGVISTSVVAGTKSDEAGRATWHLDHLQSGGVCRAEHFPALA